MKILSRQRLNLADGHTIWIIQEDYQLFIREEVRAKVKAPEEIAQEINHDLSFKEKLEMLKFKLLFSLKRRKSLEQPKPKEPVEEVQGEDIMEIELKPLKNAQPWRLGFRNDKYYSVALVAYHVYNPQEPKLDLNVPNIILTIDRHQNTYTMSGIVYASDENTAASLAYKFKKANKQSFEFDIEPKLTPYYLQFDLVKLLDNIVSNGIEYHIKTPTTEHVIKHDSNKIFVIVPSQDPGVYAVNKEGQAQRVSYNLFGEVFDYMDININAMLAHFNLNSQYLIIDDAKLRETIKDRFVNGGTLTGEDLQNFLSPKDPNQSLPPVRKEPWKIVLKYKEATIKQIVEILNRKLGIDPKRLDSIVRNIIDKALREGNGRISLKYFQEVLTPEEFQRFKVIIEELRHVFRREDKEMESLEDINTFVINTLDNKNSNILDLLIYGLVLKAKKDNKQIIIAG